MLGWSMINTNKYYIEYSPLCFSVVFGTQCYIYFLHIFTVFSDIVFNSPQIPSQQIIKLAYGVRGLK